MADELTIRFRIKYVRNDIVWYHPERDDEDVILYTISGDQALANIQSFDDTTFSPPSNGVDLGDADSSNGYIYLENITEDDGYIDIVESASGDYTLARLYYGDSMFMQRGNESPTVEAVSSSGYKNLLVIAVDN